MPPLLPLTELALADYRGHIARYPDTDHAVLDYLVRHINSMMCAEVELVATRLIRERLEFGCRDAATANFLKSLGRSSVRSAKFGELRDSIALLGSTYRARFSDLVHQSVGDAGVEKLGTSVAKRDQAAHERPPSITFQELEAAYTVANQVVEAVRLTLET